MRIEDAFTRLLGRQATDEERMRLYRTRDALGLQDNDALWLMLMALQSHQTQYDEMPEKIEAAINSILGNARETAEREMKGTAVRIHGELVQSVAKTAQEVAKSVAGRSMAKWAIGALGAAVLVVLGSAGAGFYWGHNSAKNEAAAAAAWMATPGGQNALIAYTNDPERAQWAGTRDARSAYVMSRTGELQALAECSKTGWNIEKHGEIRYCYPKAVKNGMYGWAMP